jgi:PQQ-dependent dehydrogenase (s-GDH family)
MPIPNVYQTGGQDGLMGIAFDRNFNSTHYIYLAYTYLSPSPSDNNTAAASSNINSTSTAPSINDPTNPNRHTKITRFTYYEESSSLGAPKDLISGLTGSVDHNSGRLLFGQDGKLYYTTGDRGNNQLSRYCLPIRAQMLPTEDQIKQKDWTAYEGKVLRMNPDGSIPADNPTINGVKSHIFTYGHRNPQGLTLGPNGNIYVSEHGDKSDDEFNRLVPGGNYGWPYVATGLPRQIAKT